VNKKKIIILGASRYYSKSIEAARNAGYYVITLDRNPLSEGFKAADESHACDIADKEGVLKIAADNNVAAIVPLNDVGVPVASYVAGRLNLPGLTEQAMIWATNKEEMRKRWIEKNIPCPKVYVATEKEEFYKGVEYVGYPCILKPAHGLGGASRGVIVVKEAAELEKAIEFAQSFYEDKTTLIETFIDAEYEHSAEVLIYKGVPHVIAVSDKIKTPLPYRVDKNVLYPTLVNGERLDSLKKVICDSVVALGIDNGAAHVELATTNNGFYLFELGARCGGGGTPEPIVHFSTGINEFVEMVRILAGDEPQQLIPKYNRGCNYHFLTPCPGMVKSINGTDEINSLKGVLDFECFKKAGDEIVAVTVGTERSGFIITAAETRDEAYALGVLAENLLQIEYQS
jgi:biotin carboxylase